jgi:glutathione peroxidase
MSVYEYSAELINGEIKPLSDYEGKVLLIVNTASKCGFTPQFLGLEKLYRAYRALGFEILGFPSNQFMNQELDNNEDIQSFCQLNYGVTFPMFRKINVNGPNAHPLYQYLKLQAGGVLFKHIKWNFTKFLINSQGKVVKRFSPATTPEEINEYIRKLIPGPIPK